MMVADVGAFLAVFAPPELAAEWDNVGLLVGDRQQKVERVMTCLTITPATVAEAVRERADLIVTHHPFPFRPLKRLTTDSPTGRMLLDLVRAGIAIHSPHTAFDSAAQGINQQLAEGLGLTAIEPLEPSPGDEIVGTGRHGRLPQPASLEEVAKRLKAFLNLDWLHLVGNVKQPIVQVGIACGSAGEFLELAARRGCQLFITGETRMHTCYEAEAIGVAILLVGHYASERFAVERLADILARQFPSLQVWASRDERDPLCWA